MKRIVSIVADFGSFFPGCERMETTVDIYKR